MSNLANRVSTNNNIKVEWEYVPDKDNDYRLYQAFELIFSKMAYDSGKTTKKALTKDENIVYSEAR